MCGWVEDLGGIGLVLGRFFFGGRKWLEFLG